MFCYRVCDRILACDHFSGRRFTNSGSLEDAIDSQGKFYGDFFYFFFFWGGVCLFIHREILFAGNLLSITLLLLVEIVSFIVLNGITVPEMKECHLLLFPCNQPALNVIICQSMYDNLIIRQSDNLHKLHL